MNDMGHFPIPEERLVALLSDSKMNSLEREKCVSVYCSEWSYVPPTYVLHLKKNRSADFGGTITSGFGGTNTIQQSKGNNHNLFQVFGKLRINSNT